MGLFQNQSFCGFPYLFIAREMDRKEKRADNREKTIFDQTENDINSNHIIGFCSR